MGAGSLAEFRSNRAAPATCPCDGHKVSGGLGPYLTAPATCPCFGRGVSGGVSVLLACPADLPFCVGRVVSGGVWSLPCAGPSPRHFCAGLRLCSGLALTTRGRHAQRLVCPAWARVRVRDRPPLRWAHDLRSLGPYLALGRVLATLALGSDSVAGRPGAATVSGDQPLLRWAHDLRLLGPYPALGRVRPTFALGPGPLALPLLCAGLGFVAYASAWVSNPWPFRPLSTLGALSLCSWLI